MEESSKGTIWYTECVFNGLSFNIQFGWQKKRGDEPPIPIRVFSGGASIWSMAEEKDKHQAFIRPFFCHLDGMPIIGVSTHDCMSKRKLLKVIPLSSMLYERGMLPHQLLKIKVGLSKQEGMDYVLDEDEDIEDVSGPEHAPSEAELQKIEGRMLAYLE